MTESESVALPFGDSPMLSVLLVFCQPTNVIIRHDPEKMQALFSNFFKFFSKSFQIPEKPCNLKVFKDPSPLLFHLFSKESCCTGCQLKLCLSHFLFFIPGKEDHRSHRISFTDDGTDCFRSNPFRLDPAKQEQIAFPLPLPGDTPCPGSSAPVPG